MPKIPNARSQKSCEIYKKSREYQVTYVKQITLKVQMSPSPPKHRKLIAQARDKSMRPSTSGWSKLTSRKYACCQMLQVSQRRLDS